MKLQDKVVVITGSTSGLGEACAHRFAAEGAKVVVTGRQLADVERVANAIGTVGLPADITIEESVRAVAELARRTYGEIDVWFSNAGASGPPQPDIIPDDSSWESGWNLHVMSHVYAAREVLPAMLERGDGYLLQTASIVALSVQADKAAYSVSKHAALALAEWLAVTYRPRGVKVSCFCPGAMLTPMLLGNQPVTDHPMRQRAAPPDEVAARLVQAIAEERFLILDSDAGIDALMTKATDYERWIGERSRP